MNAELLWTRSPESRVTCASGRSATTDESPTPSSTGTMWRGLEVILRWPRPARDAWAFVERICGVCTGNSRPAAVRSVEDALGIKIPKNANIMRNLVNATLYVHDHLVHFYQLSALDWVDVVSALRPIPAKPRRSSRKSPESSACLRGLLPRRPEPPEEVRRERPARHLQERLLGPSGHEAAARREPSCRHALS